MGSFANSVFSVLLGWVRSAVSWLWHLLSNDEGSGMIAWLGDNWKVLVVILCAAGILVDFVVHMLRWRPYRVWGSFFRRLRGKDAEEEPEEMELPPRPVRRRPFEPVQEEMEEVPEEVQPAVRREWIYPDGTARTEDVWEEEPAPVEEAPMEQPSPATMYNGGLHPSSADLSARYVMNYARPQAEAPAFTGRAGRRAAQAFTEDDAVPPQFDGTPSPEEAVMMPAAGLAHYDPRPAALQPAVGLEDYPQPVSAVAPAVTEDSPSALPEAPETPPEPVERRPFRRAIRVALPKNFGVNDEDELQLRYQPAPPAVDKKQAYREPVYPPSWKPPAQTGAAETGEEKSRWN